MSNETQTQEQIAAPAVVPVAVERKSLRKGKSAAANPFAALTIDAFKAGAVPAIGDNASKAAANRTSKPKATPAANATGKAANSAEPAKVADKAASKKADKKDAAPVVVAAPFVARQYVKGQTMYAL